MENLIKYPRTPHLPWSPGRTNDDRVLPDTKHFEGKEVEVSIKYDGENSTLYNNYIHARSLDSRDHESRHWLKSFHAQVKNQIPEGWRICGENLFAQHSICYENLESYFLAFSIWDDRNVCLSYDDTTEFCIEFGISQVTTIFRGDWRDEKFNTDIFKDLYPEHEGYVVRLVDEFKFEDFGKSVAKYVRINHVQTDKHWMYKKVIQNKLRK